MQEHTDIFLAFHIIIQVVPTLTISGAEVYGWINRHTEIQLIYLKLQVVQILKADHNLLLIHNIKVISDIEGTNNPYRRHLKC